MEGRLAYLFKKRKIKQQVIYETKDVVYGFYFINTDNENRFNIITGKYAGESTYYLGSR